MSATRGERNGISGAESHGEHRSRSSLADRRVATCDRSRQWRGARDGEEVPARRRGARVGGQWAAAERGPGGAPGPGRSRRECSAGVGIAAGRPAGAVPRPGHDVAERRAPAADAGAGVARSAWPAHSIQHAGTLRVAVRLPTPPCMVGTAIRCAWRRRHPTRWPRWISNAWACCALRQRAVASGSGA